MSLFDNEKFSELIAQFQQLEKLESNGVLCHRFRSWTLCYEVFGEFYKKDNPTINKKDKDLLALHLGMYLASLGMYRGATFNIHYNYTIHRSIISLLFSKEAQELRKNNHDLEYLKIHSKDIKKLYDEITIKYSELLNHTWKDVLKLTADAKDRKATSILISEVLLGTLGCIPAYDNYLKKGLEISKLTSNLSNNNIEQCISELSTFFETNITNEVYQTTYQKAYPIMKLLDIYFWKLGRSYSSTDIL